MAGVPIRRWYHGWNIIAVCILIQASGLGVTINCLTFFLEDWSHEFDMPISQLVLAAPLLGTGAALVQPLIGVLCSRYSVRKIMLSAAVLIGISHFALAAVGAGWQILALYFTLIPLSVGLCGTTTTQTLVSRWFVRRRNFAFSIAAMGLVIAGVVFPPIVVWLMQFFGWRGTWMVFGAAALTLVFALGWLVLRDRPSEDEGSYYIVPEPPHPDGADMPFMEIMKRPNFWIVLAVCSPVMLANSAIAPNLAPFATDKGISLADAAILLGALNAAAVIGKLAIGIISERIGNRLSLLLIAIVTALSTFILLLPDVGLVALAICVIGIGAGQGVWVLLFTCTAEEYGTLGLPRALGMISSFTLFQSYGSPVFAWMEETTGSYHAGIVALSICMLGGIVAALFYKPRTLVHAEPEAVADALQQSSTIVPVKHLDS